MADLSSDKQHRSAVEMLIEDWERHDRPVDSRWAAIVMRKALEDIPSSTTSTPVAWRYRYHHGVASEIKGMWKYADTEDECNQSAYYEREPLYSVPSARGSSEREAKLEKAVKDANDWLVHGEGVDLIYYHEAYLESEESRDIIAALIDPKQSSDIHGADHEKADG